MKKRLFSLLCALLLTCLPAAALEGEGQRAVDTLKTLGILTDGIALSGEKLSAGFTDLDSADANAGIARHGVFDLVQLNPEATELDLVVNAPDNAEAKRTKVQEGDLLISITADLGRTGVVTEEIADHGAYINQHLTCIRLNREVLEPLYVAYFMESPAGKEQFASKNQSAVKAGLNFNSINTLRLLVPPLDDQQQFAAFVAQIDKSKSAIVESLAETQTLYDSLMQKYFG